MVIKQSQATVGGNLEVGVDGKILLLVTALEHTVTQWQRKEPLVVPDLCRRHTATSPGFHR